MGNASIGPCVWLRRLPFVLADGVPREKHERYFVCRAERFAVLAEAVTDLEAVSAFRWWSPDEIEESGEVFAPSRLGALLRELLRDGVPAEPFDVGL